MVPATPKRAVTDGAGGAGAPAGRNAEFLTDVNGFEERLWT